MPSISNTWSFVGNKGPLGILWCVIRTLLEVLVYLPATGAAIGVLFLLAANNAPMAQTVVTELVEFQAQGADSAPDLLHLKMCDKFSPVAILCNSHSVKTYTIDQAAAYLESLAIKVYGFLVFISLLCWLLVRVPHHRLRYAHATSITKPTIPATEAERP
ncbi:TPA: hypothetical protein L4936_001665 [Pseudomonas aeruginosa]|uniref:hypothetical protein n=1 Tax=Aquipseudomonas alcaligenes TaxID=43263 RepID=UPI001F44B9F2|nr:hypothetical protein [Pseudomonas alcaligenes]BDC78645.1 hypothetical protein MRCP2_p3800 [Pseudomonas alcaligenes]HBO6962676.1 hypothetical protein [Pseudomonas aeruginosa]HBO7218719.1 hypothetical protein [Pseudomonas aeruginosa]